MAMSLAKGKISMLISVASGEYLSPCPWQTESTNPYDEQDVMPDQARSAHCRGGCPREESHDKKLPEKNWSRLCIRSLIQQKII